MNHSIRSLVVLLTFGIVAVLALLPAGRVGQTQQGLLTSFVSPSVALARISTIVITASNGLIFTRPAFTHAPGLDARGHEVTVHGHITCDKGEVFRVDVIVSQQALGEVNGALAKGGAQGFCTGEIHQPWIVKAKTQASTVLDVGVGSVCAVATTQGKGPINDAFQWCKHDAILE